jgi:hypothetical protein
MMFDRPLANYSRRSDVRAVCRIGPSGDCLPLARLPRRPQDGYQPGEDTDPRRVEPRAGLGRGTADGSGSGLGPHAAILHLATPGPHDSHKPERTSGGT